MRFRLGVLAVAACALGALVVAGPALTSRSSSQTGAARAWSERSLKGTVRMTGQVPLTVTKGGVRFLHAHKQSAQITLNFGFPLKDKPALDKLIAQEGRTHRYIGRAELYRRFSPPQAQYAAVASWLKANGFRITHTTRDRLTIAARASAATIEKALHLRINDYVSPGFSFRGVKVPAYSFYSNTTAATLPARLGIQAVSGLSDIDRFFTSYQLSNAKAKGGPQAVKVRSGGYWPADLRSLYNITGHGFDGTGQTLGFTLWTAPESQAAMNKFSTDTGDQLITVDPACTATANSPSVPSSCSTATVAGDHLLTILENGNVSPGTNFGSNVETALDIEAAHGIATHAGLKYYASECHPTPDPNTGLANAGCNGTDVGMEMAMEDAANDPTLHSVSNSWAYGGEDEWGQTDPFVVTTSNILAFAAAAGTTFYFSTGDSGTYESGYPSDSQYVVAVGGTSTYSTSDPGTYSTTTTWSGGGSWCSALVARPAWQTGAGVSATASCPGRVIPDVSAVADPNTGVRFTSTTASGTQSGQVGGTSLAAPVMNGLEAVTKNFVNAQTYPGSTPAIGFEAPLLYQLGNSGHADSYYRDVQCGNTANPTSGPDGDAAVKGWDAATGWGEPDWFQFSEGIASTLGATNLSVPPSLTPQFKWTCAKTPSNSTERAFSCPTATTCYAVGNSSGGTPWYGKFMAGGAWGAVNTIFKSTDGGQTWFPSNSDMFSIACTSGATCMTVGAGGRERRTTDGGSTWTDVATAPGNNKPLTQITCPSGSICYAVGDRGNAMKSTDGGVTWTWLSTGDGNPIYGLSCPSTSVCYATDIYAHVFKTTNGGSNWTAETTPITTPQSTQVAETGGPNPWGGLTGISCPNTTTCVAVGIYATVSGQTNPNPDPPIVTTTDGVNWTRQVSGTGTGNFLQAVSCVPSSTNCWAVGRGGKIVNTTNLTTWTAQTSNTTNYLNSVLCESTSFCIAVGQGGTVDVYNGTTWTATTGNGGTGTLADVDCSGNLVCYATGKQGITLLTTTGGTSWTIQAGGGSQTNQLNGIACTSAGTCYAAGNAGTILKTSNGGQSWLSQTSGTTTNLNAMSCFQANGCVAVGAVASGAAVVRFTNDGTSWNGGSNTGAQALNGVSCVSGGACLAVGASGAAVSTSTGGGTWNATSTGTTNALNAVACPSSIACYAVGASGTILKFPNAFSSPTAQTSGTTNTLNGVACLTSTFCEADGTFGTVLGTTDGTSWSQQGNPLSGPTTALNGTNLTLNGAACTTARCLIGAPAQGDIMVSSPIVSSIGDAHTWLGLAPNGLPIDDRGTPFDVRVDLLYNGNVVSTGLTRCVTGLQTAVQFAKQATTSFGTFNPVLLGIGDTLSVKVFARIGTNPSDGFCGGPKQSAAGLRLYYDASAQASNFSATLAAANTDLYLHSNGTACATGPSSGVSNRFLDSNSPTGTVKCQDSGAVHFSGGNPYQEIGEWSLTGS